MDIIVPNPKNKKQAEYYEILFPVHKHQWLRAYKKFINKISSFKARYRLDNIKTLFKENYGSECPYCGCVLNVNNMSLDHITPIARNGNNIEKNIQVTCKVCNRRKGRLTDKEYRELLKLIDGFEKQARQYVLAKLSGKDYGSK